MNGKDVSSRYAQVGSKIRFERQNGEWIDKLVQGKRASIPDLVAAKLDVRAWFATLTKQMKQIASDLALGCSTSEAALKYGVTAGRISQLRRALEASWLAYGQEEHASRMMQIRPPSSPGMESAECVLASNFRGLAAGGYRPPATISCGVRYEFRDVLHS